MGTGRSPAHVSEPILSPLHPGSRRSFYEAIAKHSVWIRSHAAELFHVGGPRGSRAGPLFISISSANTPRSRATSLIFEFILSPWVFELGTSYQSARILAVHI